MCLSKSAEPNRGIAVTSSIRQDVLTALLWWVCGLSTPVTENMMFLTAAMKWSTSLKEGLRAQEVAGSTSSQFQNH